MAKTYDAKSYDLAVHFLSDNPSLDTFDKIHHLALHIQESIEGWIETERLREQRANG